MSGFLVEVLRWRCLFEGTTGHRYTGRHTPRFPSCFVCTAGLPASDPGELWTRPKLLWDADSESFACSLQPGLFPVRFPYPGNSGEGRT